VEQLQQPCMLVSATTPVIPAWSNSPACHNVTPVDAADWRTAKTLPLCSVLCYVSLRS
jgi:hypothetical protein